MKRYRFEIVITEGNDESWEDIESRGVTGCDEVQQTLLNCLSEYGLDENVRLIEFTDK